MSLRRKYKSWDGGTLQLLNARSVADNTKQQQERDVTICAFWSVGDEASAWLDGPAQSEAMARTPERSGHGVHPVHGIYISLSSNEV